VQVMASPYQTLQRKAGFLAFGLKFTD